MAYYSSSSNGKFLLCIDNERHAWYRSSYSYKGIMNQKKRVPYAPDDGIWYLDVNSKNINQILSLKELIAIKPLSNMKDAVHYVEHIVINPNDKRFSPTVK